MTEPEFPRPIRMNGRLMFRRYEVERFKMRCIALATGEPFVDTGKPKIETFVPAETLAKELGLSRRTLNRRIEGLAGEEAA